MKHLRWEQHGRTFIGDTPDKLVYKSSVGQHNVDLGDGTFAPYVWDAKNNTIKFADCEVRLVDAGLEFWNKDERLNKVAIHPESKKDLEWERKSPSIGSIVVEEIDNLTSKAEIKVSYTLTTPEQEATVAVRAGYNAKVHFELSNKAFIDGEQRLLVQFEEKGTEIQRVDKEGNPLPSCGYHFGKSWWKWEPVELDTHASDEDILVTKVRVAEKSYKKDETLKISPDTWGSDVGISANEDDGDEYGTTWNVNGAAGNRCFFGSDGTRLNIGLRWQNITIPQGSTIDSAILDTYVDSGVTGTPTGSWYGADEDNIGQWSSTIKPSTRTATTASAVYSTFVSGAWKNTTITSIVQEIIDRVGWSSGNAIGFFTSNSVASNNYLGIQDYSNAGSEEAELTITYTPAAPGSAIKIDRGGQFGLFRGMFKQMVPGSGQYP